MTRTIFLAGASGAIGSRLSVLLRKSGFRVVGTTRREAGAERLRAIGVEPILLDIFDEGATRRALMNWSPEIVINQLTALSALKSGDWTRALAENARIRSEGTPILVRAAREAGARRLVSQSIAWLYAPGSTPHGEDDPLKEPVGADTVSVGGVLALEKATLEGAPLEGVVLRYGWLYGPGTGQDEPLHSPGVHVDAAALAAMLAIDGASAGSIFNIAEPSPEISTDKALSILDWRPDFRIEDSVG